MLSLDEATSQEEQNHDACEQQKDIVYELHDRSDAYKCCECHMDMESCYHCKECNVSTLVCVHWCLYCRAFLGTNFVWRQVSWS